MTYARVGLGYISPGVNPLNPEIVLTAGQALIRGPAATGPRATIVWTQQPSSWPRWITPGPTGYPEDLGTIVGGTWDGSGAQSLPELVTTGLPSWVWLVAAAVLYYLVFGKRSSRGTWD